MERRLSRREFLQAALAAGTAVPLSGLLAKPAAAARLRSPNERLNLAVIGVANRGGASTSLVLPARTGMGLASSRCAAVAAAFTSGWLTGGSTRRTGRINRPAGRSPRAAAMSRRTPSRSN